MTPERQKVLLEVADHEEFVTLDDEMRPVEGTRTAFLHLKAATGLSIRAQIPHECLDPILAMMWPEDF